MIYKPLASYYDDLVKDDDATQSWVDWIQEYIASGSVLECACGTGEITHRLSTMGYQMNSLDISQNMIQRAKEKDLHHRIQFFCRDMTDLSRLSQYDAILCLCDSFNYLLELDQIRRFFKEAHDHLKTDGLLFFDTHSLDRLVEFEEEFNETGHIQDVDYQWSITSEDNIIYQDFAFYREDGQVLEEHHMQRVYTPQELQKALDPYFEIEKITTDFTLEGIQEGEKYFYVCKRK